MDIRNKTAEREVLRHQSHDSILWFLRGGFWGVYSTIWGIKAADVVYLNRFLLNTILKS